MRRCIYALLLALAWLQSATAQADNVYTGPCNATLYHNWYDQKYDGVLQSTPQFWIFSNAPLSNGLAMEKAAVQCHTRLNQLRLDRAGRHGPVEDWWIYDMMCSEECMQSDKLRRTAMATSGCDCLQLSTPEGDPKYRVEGDWCTANSGRLLCSIFDQCGIWNCRISDFMCPRYEYNKYRVPLRGYGSCSGAGRGAAAAVALTAVLAAALMALLA
eukprot:16235-Heterococcus_DN1.PRE.4